MSKTIEITTAVAHDVLPCLEEQLANVVENLSQLEIRRDHLKTTIAELRQKLAGDELPLRNGDSLAQRRPRGYGDTAIVKALESLPPNQGGLTMAELQRRTGVNYSIIFRILNQPKRNKGRFVQEGDLWKLKK